jgi:DNA-binding NarL/FixJ family response regulator
VRALVVDDHDLFRSGVATLLDQHGVEVVGQAASGREAVVAVETCRPDIVLMDLSMPGMNGIEATRQVLAVTPGLPVVMLTGSEEERDVVEALLAGAVGYLLKTAGAEQIVAGMRAVLAGDALISPRVSRVLVERVHRADETAAAARPDVALDDRERDVLRLLVEGREDVEIARLLYVSTSTVKHHVATLVHKLGVENRVQAAVLAVRAGLA